MTDRYTLISEIGRGGMGLVWKARDEQTGTIVAIKLLRDVYAEDPDYIRRFEREAQLAQRIDSIHVVKVLDYGLRDKVPYLALEYIDGPSLHDALSAHGAYDWPQTRAILAQLAQGLADANAAGVIHRDIKPSNVLMAPDGTAKLTDFGISRGLNFSRITATSTIVGTPAYLAPEGPKDARSDLYSLGIIGYELLTGAVPFKGTTYQEIVIAHIREAPDLSVLPEEARPIIAWLLAKDPAERPQRASALLPVLWGGVQVPRAVHGEPSTVIIKPEVRDDSEPTKAAVPPDLAEEPASVGQDGPARVVPALTPAEAEPTQVLPRGTVRSEEMKPAAAWRSSRDDGDRPQRPSRSSTPVGALLLGIALVVCLVVAAIAIGGTAARPTPFPTDPLLAAVATDTLAPMPIDVPAPTLGPTPVPTVAWTPDPTPTPRFPATTPGQYVYDWAKILYQSQADSVNAAAAAFATKHNCNIWFATESFGSASQATSARVAADAAEILREWSTGCDIVFVLLVVNHQPSWSEVNWMGPSLPSDFYNTVYSASNPYRDKLYIADEFTSVIKTFDKALP